MVHEKGWLEGKHDVTHILEYLILYAMRTYQMLREINWKTRVNQLFYIFFLELLH